MNSCKHGCDNGIHVSYEYNEYDGGTPEYELCECYFTPTMQVIRKVNSVITAIKDKLHLYEDIPF